MPDKIRPIIGKREIWVSYGTDSFASAKQRHSREMAVVDALFAAARKQLKTGSGPAGIGRDEAARLAQATEEDIRYAARAWFHQEERRLLAGWRTSGSDDGGSAVDRAEALDALHEDQAAIHGQAGEEWAARNAALALSARHLALPPGPAFSLAVDLFQTAAREAVDRAVQRMGGQLVSAPSEAVFADVTAGSPAPEAPPPRTTFRELCNAYLAAPERAGLAPTTTKKYDGFKRVLCDLLGADTPASLITREDCRRVQAALLAMPANAYQRYPGLDAKALVEAAKRDGAPAMHPKSVGNHLDFLATLFKWGRKEGVLDMPKGNPAEGLNAITAKTVTASSGEKRRPFTPAELKVIFSAPLYVGCKDDGAGYDKLGPSRPRRGRFWVPLLGLYAGLRLNEACQLRADDVEAVDGVHVIHVRATVEGQRLKTRAAERRIPVHPELVRIGFLHLVSKQRKARQPRLFPDLPSSVLGNYSDPFSKWFARFLSKVHVTAPGAVFHSFRHGFRDRMREAGIPRDVANMLGGWTFASDQQSEGDGYGSGGSAPFLAEHVQRIAYPGLDLSHLYSESE